MNQSGPLVIDGVLSRVMLERPCVEVKLHAMELHQRGIVGACFAFCIVLWRKKSNCAFINVFITISSNHVFSN